MLVKQAKLDPRVKRTRQLLQKALAELIAEKDFQNVTVQDIAARAEVNRATFYAHFDDKFALLNYSLRAAFDSVLEGKLPGLPIFSLASLHSLTLALCDFLAGFFDHCQPHGQTNGHLLMAAQVQMYTYEVVLGWLTESEMPRISSHTTLEMVAQVTSWTIFGCVFQWATTGHQLAPESLADQVTGLLKSGIAAYFS